MKKIKYNAKCPYEIGGKVQFEKCGNKKRMEITDVITQISAKTGQVIFILELDGWYKLNTNLHEVKVGND